MMDQRLTILYFTLFTHFYAKIITQNFYVFCPLYILRFTFFTHTRN